MNTIPLLYCLALICATGCKAKVEFEPKPTKIALTNVQESDYIDKSNDGTLVNFHRLSESANIEGEWTSGPYPYRTVYVHQSSVVIVVTNQTK